MSAAWDCIRIGAQTGVLHVLVTDELIETHLAQSGLDETVYQSGQNARVAPPDLLSSLAVRELFQTWIQREIGPNIRVRQVFRFLEPITVGTMVEATGHVIDKSESRGKQFFTVEATFREPDGRALAVDRRVQMLLPKKDVS